MVIIANENPSFCGKIYGVPDILVDNFNDKSKSIYFLSHVHADHYSGLLEWSDEDTTNKTIYMSRDSRNIFVTKVWRRTIQGIAREMITGEAHDINGTNVTLIPVEHMPGAVMFLFETTDGKTILYTGDFVFPNDNRDNLRNLVALHRNEKPISIDLLYYDATFSNFDRGYRLPRQSDSISKITRVITDYLENAAYNVEIITGYDYGYENLLRAIADSTKIKVQIEDTEKLNVYREIYGPHQFTERDSRIKHYRTNEQRNWVRFEINQRACNNYTRRIVVYAYGWRHGNNPIHINSNCIELFYPTHCTMDQIDHFIDYLGIPRHKCVPFNRDSPGDVDIDWM